MTYRNGRCVNTPIGINTISKEIAIFLRLPQQELFTGHRFRRSSPTQLANRGGDLLTLKRHGGWKSSTVVEGYAEGTLKKKIEVAQKLSPQNMDLQSCSSISEPNSSTNTNAIGNSTVQQNIVTDENIPGVVIHSKYTSNVTVNVYNNCTFYGRS